MKQSAYLKNLQQSWNILGKADPFWAVLTNPSKRGGGWDENDFFRTGRYEITRTIVNIRSLSFPRHYRKALDFGCGVGRLTQAMCLHFEDCWGVDIAPSMIESANNLNRFGTRCHYVVNDRPDLSLFQTGAFDFVYSNIVLQHIDPAYSAGYIRELIRVLASGGMLVFQLPAVKQSEDSSSCLNCPLPLDAFNAAIIPLVSSISATAGALIEVPLVVENHSKFFWPCPSKTPDRFQISLGSHWLFPNHQLLRFDSARLPLPRKIGPGEWFEETFLAPALTTPGEYCLEIDLVQDGVAWFKEKGSKPSVIPVQIGPGNGKIEPRILPVMEMHGIPEDDVRKIICGEGSRLVRVESDSWAPGWDGRRYFVTKD